MTQDEKQNLINRLKQMSREDLEEKFISLFEKLSDLQSQNKDEFPNVDFTKFANVRRQQYLHKAYSPDTKPLNAILKYHTDNPNKHLQKFLNQLNHHLENTARLSNDKPKTK